MQAGNQREAMLQEKIHKLKKEKNAVILAHLYQRGEVQDVADFVGDSLGLSQEAAKTDANVIVFCGVDFMAESAAVLSPDKIVVLPELFAQCPMANMVDVERLRAKKREHPNAAVVCYVNSSAAVKAESDICCTSANAVKIVESLTDYDEVIFIPDRNLGMYVASQTKKKIIPWDGFCFTHDRLTAEEIKRAKAEHPAALVLVHPECRPEVTALADGVFSTSGMIKFAKTNPAREFIIATEMGILHQFRKQIPDKQFYLASEELVCVNMKVTNLEKVLRALETLEPRITVPEDVRKGAVRALARMLAVK